MGQLADVLPNPRPCPRCRHLTWGRARTGLVDSSSRGAEAHWRVRPFFVERLGWQGSCVTVNVAALLPNSSLSSSSRWSRSGASTRST